MSRKPDFGEKIVRVLILDLPRERRSPRLIFIKDAIIPGREYIMGFFMEFIFLARLNEMEFLFATA